jgi:hypothetical protein
LSAAAPDFVESLLSPEKGLKPVLLDQEPSCGNIVLDTRTLKESSGGETHWKRVICVQVEEIEDEYWAMEARMPKARSGIIEDTDPLEDETNVEEMLEAMEDEYRKEVESVS